MKLIALTGIKGSGKSAAATVLVAEGLHRYSISSPIKAMLLNLGVPHDSLYGGDKEKFLPQFGSTGRKLIQSLSDWGRNIDPHFWINMLEANPEFQRDVRGAGAVIDDLRFPHECDMIQRYQGDIWRVVRPGLEMADTHITETAQESIVPDHTLINKDSLDDLSDQTLSLFQSWLDALPVTSENK